MNYYYILLIALIVLIVIFSFTYLDFLLFLSKRYKELKFFKTVETKFGPIKYYDNGLRGEKTILFVAGAGIGIDSVLALDLLFEQNYRVITIARPGYHGVPIKDNDSFERHAEIYKLVLDELKIKDVIVFGISMGGPSALKFAEMYNPKALLLWSALTQDFQLKIEAIKFPLGQLAFFGKNKNIVSWIIYRSLKIFPRIAILSILKVQANLSLDEVRKISKSIIINKVQKKRLLKFYRSTTPLGELYDGMINDLNLAKTISKANLNKIECKVLAFHSNVDKILTIDHLLTLKENIRDIQTVVLKSAGHFVWWGIEGEQVVDNSLFFLKNI
jgi:pimeloyl-ACP methyl ester carboxylesterase